MSSMQQVAFLIAVCLLTFVATSVLADNELTINPDQPVISRPVGGSVLLSCIPNVQKENLVTNLMWKDPRGIEISKNHPFYGRLTLEHLGSALALIIDQFDEQDAGTYICSGTYANNVRLMRNVTLESIFPIKWEDAPTVQNPVMEHNYKIRCKVSANPSPYVDWSKNGKPLDANQRYVVQTDGLWIPNVEASDDGTYTCRAIVVQTGEIATRNILVEVHTTPTFGEMNKTFELVEGTAASILCNASGKPAPAFMWIRDKTREDLSKSSRFSVNPATGLLTINPVEEQDSGEYRCVARNPAAKAEKGFQVTVLVRPKVTQLMNITVNTGGEARLRCVSRGRPYPTVSFKKYGTDVVLSEGVYPYDNRISVERTENPENREIITDLVIKRVERKDDGLYVCVAKNEAGELFKTGHITVQFAPTFVDSGGPQTVWSWEGRPVNLSCIAESIPNATIRWKRNEIEIFNDRNLRQIGEGPQSVLIVTPREQHYYGPYKCLAQNTLGKSEYVIWLREASAPGIVSQVTQQKTTATSVKFIIHEPHDTGMLNLTSISVQYIKGDANGWLNAPEKTWPVGSQYWVEDLLPDTDYTFRFAARNPVGVGAWSGATRLRTFRRSPPSPPVLRTEEAKAGVVESKLPNEIEVRWKLPEESGGEPLVSYRIRYCIAQNLDPNYHAGSGCITIDLQVSQVHGLSYVLQRLAPDTLYRIELTATNQVGTSSPSVALYRTAKGEANDLLVAASSSKFALSSMAIIAIVVASLLIILILVDVSCFALNNAGIMYLICGRRNPKDDNKIASLYGWRFPLPYCSQKTPSYASGPPGVEVLPPPDADLVFEDKEPLRENGTARVALTDERGKMKDTKTTFDDRHSTYKTTFIGKNSEV